MKKTLYIIFVCVSFIANAQKKACPISNADPSPGYYYSMVDTIAYLPYFSEIRIKPEIERLKEIDKDLHKNPTIPTLKIKLKRTEKETYESERLDFVIKNGIGWFFEDSLMSVSKDYDFRTSLYFNVNCLGEPYDIGFKQDQRHPSETYANEYGKFKDSIRLTLKNIPLLKPGVVKGRVVNMGRYEIDIRSDKGKYICSVSQK